VSRALAFAIVFLAPAVASAFCRTTTVSIAPDFSPSIDMCWTQGKPLYWKNACTGYSVNQTASRQVSFNDANEQMARAFSRWTGKSCAANPEGSRVSIDVRDLGPVACAQVQYNKTDGNANIIMFRDDAWPHNDPNNTLALTTVTYNPDTGEIYDADMEINTFGAKVTLTDPVPADGYDFASIVTHESGHFLGLAHSGDEHATMFAQYQPGSTTKRELAPDDVLGICAAYPPDGTRVTAAGPLPADPCDPTPRRGLKSECKVSKGCNLAGADPSNFMWVLALFFLRRGRPA
jgi:hypothetical protein